MFSNFFNRDNFKKGRGEEDKKMESQPIKFCLKVSYGGDTRIQYFPNQSYPMVTMGKLSQVKSKFVEKFILDYADRHPGTQLSDEDLDVAIESLEESDGKDVVDLI